MAVARFYFDNTYYYIESEKVNVFPCAYRDHGIDPEARLNSEKSLTTVNGSGGGNKNYISILNGDLSLASIILVLEGYTFRLTDIDFSSFPANSTIYALIKTETYYVTSTKTSDKLGSLYVAPTGENQATSNEVLDKDFNNVKYFTGLGFSLTKPENVSYIKIYENNKLVNRNVLPINITNGKTNGSIVLNSVPNFNDETATGGVNLADGEYSIASGHGTIASGLYSYAEGHLTTASSTASHAEGDHTEASGNDSTTIAATEYYARHAEGILTKAQAAGAHAEGIETTAFGKYGAHAEGFGNVSAALTFEDRVGTSTTPYTYNCNRATSVKKGKILVVTIDNTQYYLKVDSANAINKQVSFYSLSDNFPADSLTGKDAFNVTGIATGYGAHVEGYHTIASGDYGSHAEGLNTIASGSCSHAEGDVTQAIGADAHAEGSSTYAFGEGSHAEGKETKAIGSYSHAEGEGTIANCRAQHVFGRFNVVDDSTAAVTSRGKYVEIVGNGDSSTRKNARVLDWNGNEWLRGGLYVGDTTNALGSSANEKLYVNGNTKVNGHLYINNNLVVENTALIKNTVTIGQASSRIILDCNNQKISAIDSQDATKTLYLNSNNVFITANDKIVASSGFSTADTAVCLRPESTNEINFYNSSTGDIHFGHKGSTAAISTYYFKDGQGNITAQVQAGSFYATSDKRLKENLRNYHCEKSILDLPIYKYDFIDGKKDQIGCLAQDLQEICPELIKTDNNGYLAIEESKIVYLLLDEVKKLKLEIEELKNGKCN